MELRQISLEIIDTCFIDSKYEIIQKSVELKFQLLHESKKVVMAGQRILKVLVNDPCHITKSREASTKFRINVASKNHKKNIFLLRAKSHVPSEEEVEDTGSKLTIKGMPNNSRKKKKIKHD